MEKPNRASSSDNPTPINDMSQSISKMWINYDYLDTDDDLSKKDTNTGSQSNATECEQNIKNSNNESSQVRPVRLWSRPSFELLCDVPDKEVKNEYILHIVDEVHSKEYKIPVAASKKIIDVKTDMYACSDIKVSQQIWSGWPDSCTSDNLRLNQLDLTMPVHKLSFRAAPVLESSKQKKQSSSKVSSADSDSDNYSSIEYEEITDNLYEEDDLSIEDLTIQNNKPTCLSLVPHDFENETVGSIQFITSFEEKYGVSHPVFFYGSLKEAFQEAFNKSDKDRKLLAIYVHNNESILTNVFCNQILCTELAAQYLSEYFIVWGWDVTLEINKAYFCDIVHDVISPEAVNIVKCMQRDKYPVIVVINKVEEKAEILTVIRGTMDLDELLSHLIQAVDTCNEQLKKCPSEGTEKESATESQSITEE